MKALIGLSEAFFPQLVPGPELVEDFTSRGRGVSWLLVVGEVAEERKSILLVPLTL